MPGMWDLPGVHMCIYTIYKTVYYVHIRMCICFCIYYTMSYIRYVILYIVYIYILYINIIIASYASIIIFRLKVVFFFF